MSATRPFHLRCHPLPVVLAGLTAIGSLLALAGSAVWQHWPPAAFWHLVFAVGALPLILAAMIYFTPVLTRTPEAPRPIAALPLTALLAGFAIVAWFVRGGEPLRSASPWLALGAVAGLVWWMIRRRRACLGPPHACLAWYGAALFCLGLGLVAVGGSAIWPEHAYLLRIFHLHINTLGFMGLTAIGTLQVLLPTVLGQLDPMAQNRLARDLPWSLTGALGMATGVSMSSLGLPLGWPVATVATLLYAWPLLRLVSDLRQAFGKDIWAPDQAAPLLLAAMTGLTLALFHGLAHGTGATPARAVLHLFVIGFLLPLVSGAVSQLLPVWLRPGAEAAWHRGQRIPLAAWSRGRAALLLLAGALSTTGNQALGTTGLLLGIAGAIWLMSAMLRAVWLSFSRG